MNDGSMLEIAKADMERARKDVERARIAYNQSVKAFNEQRARYERLATVAMDEEIALARERKKAEAEGNHALAALLVSGR